MITMSASSQTAEYRTFGRRVAAGRRASMLDRTLALIGLMTLAPLIVLIAITLIVETGFPVFFSQERLGKDGRLFRLYKFRKFRPDIGTATRPVTLAADSRLTRVGRFLERTKLDEIPQLWNIVRGDMAIVGPRPEVPCFADCFAAGDERVLDYLPGILGPSQVAFRDEGALYPSSVDPVVFYRHVLFPAKAELDLAYYPSRTFSRDLMWIARGVLAVLHLERRDDVRGRGTTMVVPAAEAGGPGD
jgi:lipopolysaccharide/colanic/teichoic acid biosynthesis glycosyltransferase